jgi:type II secretory pathway pseudopilin PulG
MNLLNRVPALRRSRHGFTLVEILVTMATMLIVIGAAMAAYIYGLRMTQFVKPKLGASDEARNAIALLTEDIRTAYSIRLGNINASQFEKLPAFSYQAGTAVRIFPTMDTNRFVTYFHDASDNCLKRSTNSNLSGASIVANAVTNSLVFTSEDHRGTVLTNEFNNRVIGMTLQFNQIQFPKVAVGPGNYYDYYQIRAKITRRTLF